MTDPDEYFFCRGSTQHLSSNATTAIYWIIRVILFHVLPVPLVTRPVNCPGLTRTVLVLDPCLGQALKCPGQTPVDTFWGTSDKEKIDGQPRFQVLPKFIKFLLCMPHSNADTERIFFCVSHNKTPHRSSLCNSTLSSLLGVKRNIGS